MNKYGWLLMLLAAAVLVFSTGIAAPGLGFVLAAFAGLRAGSIARERLDG